MNFCMSRQVIVVLLVSLRAFERPDVVFSKTWVHFVYSLFVRLHGYSNELSVG